MRNLIRLIVLNPFRAGHWCQGYFYRDIQPAWVQVLNPFRAGHWCQGATNTLFVYPVGVF